MILSKAYSDIQYNDNISIHLTKYIGTCIHIMPT